MNRLSTKRRHELNVLEQRLQTLAVKRGARIIADRFGYSPLKSIKYTGTISGARMA